MSTTTTTGPPSSSSAEASSSYQTTAHSYRLCLERAVAAILVESGFDTATSTAVQTLSELLQSFMYELGRSSRAFSDVACRSEPLHADVLLALVEMGQTTAGLREYAFRFGRRSLNNPGVAQPPKATQILHTGDRKPRSKLIAEMCPEYPDSHTYVRTPTHKQPVTDYVGVREKASSQKRDVERALTRFIAKTGKTHSLFNTDDTNLFPLISCDRLMPDQPALPAYLNALLFKDQIFEEDDREYAPKRKVIKEEDDDAKKLKDSNRKVIVVEAKIDKEMYESDPDDDDAQNVQSGSSGDKDSEEKGGKAEKEQNKKSEANNEAIDNPFLRPVKFPRTPGMMKRKLK